MTHFIYNIVYYVVNVYLRKAPERFGGFYNADEVDMCSRLTNLPSSHLVLHPELCEIAIDKLVDSYVYMLGFLVLGYVLSYSRQFIDGISWCIQVTLLNLLGHKEAKERKDAAEQKRREYSAKAAFTKQKNATNNEFVKQLFAFVYDDGHTEDVNTFKLRMKQQIQRESDSYRESMNVNAYCVECTS